MDLIVASEYNDLSRKAADFVAATVAAKPGCNVVLPTGNTPMGLYRELIDRRSRGEFDPSSLRIFQLDEYLGLPPNDPRSFYRWLAKSFLDPLCIPERNVVRFADTSPEPEAACRAYEEEVKAAGGYDLAVLGLGANGHLGFNEPPVNPHSPTRVVALRKETVETNARYWGGCARVPRRAVTAGMDVLLAARRILLLVSGARKRRVLRRTIEGPATPDLPASYLRRAPNVTIIADEAARPSDDGGGPT